MSTKRLPEVLSAVPVRRSALRGQLHIRLRCLLEQMTMLVTQIQHSHHAT